MIILGNVTGSLGASAADCEKLTNIKRVLFEWQGNVPEPELVLNVTVPLAFNRPHKWVQGEIHCLSECYHGFYHNGSGNVSYIVPSGSNVSIPFMQFSNQTTGSGVVKYTFFGAVPWNDGVQINDGEEQIVVYPFSAQYYTSSFPA